MDTKLKIKAKIEAIKRISGSNDLKDDEKYTSIRQIMLIGTNLSNGEIAFSVFMVLVGFGLIVFDSLTTPSIVLADSIDSFQFRLTVILSLAAGSMAVGFTGNINMKLHWVQASGSLAIMIIILVTSPFLNERVQANANSPSELKLPFSLPFISSVYADNYPQAEIEFTLTDKLDMAENTSTLQVSSKVQSDFDFDRFPAGQSGVLGEVVNTQKTPEIKYDYKITYPIGISNLKMESFDISNELYQMNQIGEVRVYSQGSVFKAPINAWSYDGEYDIRIFYNKLVDPQAIKSTENSLMKLYKSNDVKIESFSTNPRSTIEVQLVPK